YYLGLGPKGGEEGGPPSSASVGTMVHAGIEALYNGSPTAASAHLGTPPPGQDGEHAAEWQKSYDLATRMLEGYDEWLAETGADQGEVTH
ncbi:hypothetical protein M3M33_14490, partial [Loigolactobacillus coryniformis]|uniref:hypothetical protein n=1 Tax=Loigolactobacillus coryniformis TaxID=1610 RepID=UPI00201AAED6